MITFIFFVLIDTYIYIDASQKEVKKEVKTELAQSKSVIEFREIAWEK